MMASMSSDRRHTGVPGSNVAAMMDLRTPVAGLMSSAPGHVPARVWAHGLMHTSLGTPGLEK